MMFFSTPGTIISIAIILTAGIAGHYLIKRYWNAVLGSGIKCAVLFIIAESLFTIHSGLGFKNTGYLLLIYPEVIAVLIGILVGKLPQNIEIVN